jgi:hypothetical protein
MCYCRNTHSYRMHAYTFTIVGKPIHKCTAAQEKRVLSAEFTCSNGGRYAFSCNGYLHLKRVLCQSTFIVLPLLARIAAAPRKKIQVSCRLPGWTFSSVVWSDAPTRIQQTHEIV